MVQIVLSLQPQSEQELRRLAQEVYGGRKGALSRVVEEALQLMKRKIEREEAYRILLEEAKNAKNTGMGKFRREELYARGRG